MQKKILSLAITAAATLALAACSSDSKVSDPFAGKGSPEFKGAGKMPKGGGRRHIGKPYTVGGRKYYPHADPTYNKVGIASWYGPKFHGRRTANGEWFDQEYHSAAHKTLPIPSYAKVTNLENGRQLIVRINDRGPFVGDRIIDLSKKSARTLGVLRKGKARVRVQYLGPAPLNDKGSHLAMMNRKLHNGAGSRTLVASTSSYSSTRALSTGRPASGYYVQVGAYGEAENARRAKQKLRDLGPVVILPASSSYGTIYRVRVGPVKTQDQAVDLQQRAVSYGIYDAKVVNIY